MNVKKTGLVEKYIDALFNVDLFDIIVASWKKCFRWDIL